MRIPIIMFAFLFSAAAGLNAQDQATPTLQTSDRGWKKIYRIPAKQKICVRVQGGKLLKGEFVEANENEIVLLVKSDRVTISRQEIRRVSKKSRGKAALIGLGIGAGIGTPIGASGVLWNNSSNAGMKRSESIAAGTLMFGMAGAVAGGLIGMEKTIYENSTDIVRRAK